MSLSIQYLLPSSVAMIEYTNNTQLVIQQLKERKRTGMQTQKQKHTHVCRPWPITHPETATSSTKGKKNDRLSLEHGSLAHINMDPS